MMKALLICPGRGTYNRNELGYLARRHADRRALVALFDARRSPTVSALDSAPAYSPALHQHGDNASPLIFACSYADFAAIDRASVEIVAVTGNSMGWYTALACAGALSPEHAFDLVAHMGALMHARGTGGQVIHTTLDADWRPVPGRREALLGAAPGLHVSIELGGMIVLAGPTDAIDHFVETAPAGPAPFPMRLPHHAAFHTPLMAPIAAEARAAIGAERFVAPHIPMVDGRGHIWRPHMTDPRALWDYTLGEQITRTYDFTRAIGVAVREFAPDRLIVLGPGDTLGGAVIQSLLAIRWRGWTSKEDYRAHAHGFVDSIGAP